MVRYLVDYKGKTIAGAAKTAPVRDVAARCDDLAASCGLTPREREILRYLGRGHGIAFVADALVISESTVRTHVKSCSLSACHCA